MIDVNRTSLIVHAFIFERLGAICLGLPRAEEVVGLSFPVQCLFDVRLRLFADILTMVPRPIIWMRIGAPWRVVVGGGAAHIVSSLIVVLLHTAVCKFPRAAFLFLDGVLAGACIHAVAPVIFMMVIFFGVVVVVLTPRTIVINRRATRVHLTFPLKLRCACGRLFPAAFAMITARARQLAIFMLPRPNLTYVVLGGVRICGMIAILFRHIAFQGGPRRLLPMRLMPDQLRCQRIVDVRHNIRERSVIPSACVITALPHL